MVRLHNRVPSSGLDSLDWSTEVEIASMLPGKYRTAFAMIGSAQFDRPWQTILRNLRKGDELRLRWQPDYHSNDYVKQAGLHGDVVSLEVRKNQRRIDEY